MVKLIDSEVKGSLLFMVKPYYIHNQILLHSVWKIELNVQCLPHFIFYNK